MTRPQRKSVTNELGQTQTLPSDKGQFEILPGGKDTVFLGLGPEPAKVLEYFPEATDAKFVECLEMAMQVLGWVESVPKSFTSIKKEAFTPEMARECTVIRYRPYLRAFPSFWGEVTAKAAFARQTPGAQAKTVWLPHAEGDLLGRELSLAFEGAGYAVRRLDPEPLERSAATELARLLETEVPELVFSVNGKGMDPYGLGFNILREAGTKVALWMVDNPFNLLPAAKSGYWKEAKVFVTDHTFIQPLIDHGAKWVTHLPLAASPELFAEGGSLPDHAHGITDQAVFVGRSAFPNKDKFFAGLSPDTNAMAQAMAMLEDGARPDFHWWQEEVRAELWPGNEVRQVGVGAEAAGKAWRQRCLAALGDNAIIFGDSGWQGLEGITADTREPLDYYAHLPAVYRNAAAVLNITGMQLPAGLTQRHFDVWCAGGFLLTDNNPGLKIFPAELTRETTFTAPNDLPGLFHRFRAPSTEKTALRDAWRKCILEEHTYANRVQTVLTALTLK